MTKNEIENFVERKITEAKLEISEKRLTFALKLGAGFVAVFGIVLPLILVIYSSIRVSDELDFMERRVEKLIGTQLREPEIQCFYEHKPISDGSVISMPYLTSKQNKKEYQPASIIFKNIGNAPANNVRVFCYLNEYFGTKDIDPGGWFSYQWDVWHVSDEPDFPITLTYRFAYQYQTIPVLDSKESNEIQIDPALFDFKKKQEYPVIIKIYYGQPEPVRLLLNVKFN